MRLDYKSAVQFQSRWAKNWILLGRLNVVKDGNLLEVRLSDSVFAAADAFCFAYPVSTADGDKKKRQKGKGSPEPSVVLPTKLATLQVLTLRYLQARRSSQVKKSHFCRLEPQRFSVAFLPCSCTPRSWRQNLGTSATG